MGNSATHSAAVAEDGVTDLQAELTRLRRENRALTIALQEMERIAERDMLTPLHNRRYFLSALHQRLARATRYGDQMALIYIDVDGLKHINDTFGHGAGDFALIEFAQRLASSVRESDVIARIGGDEFGLILEHVSLGEACARVTALLNTIQSADCIYDGQPIRLKASFGVAAVTAGDSAEDLLGRADAAMYAAKRGRSGCEPFIAAGPAEAASELPAFLASSAASSAAAR